MDDKLKIQDLTKQIKELQKEIFKTLFEEIILPYIKENNYTLYWGTGTVFYSDKNDIDVNVNSLNHDKMYSLLYKYIDYAGLNDQRNSADWIIMRSFKGERYCIKENSPLKQY